MTAYELGQEAALKEAGVEKTAFIMPLLEGAGELAMKYGPKLWSAGKSLMSNGYLREGVINAAATGGFNAMTAKPGDRMNAFARGAGYGFLGGVAGHGAGQAVGNYMKTNPTLQKWTSAGAGRLMGKAAPFAAAWGMQSMFPSGENKPKQAPMTNLPQFY